MSVLKNKISAAIFLSIILVGIVLRTIGFGDWLIFKADQSSDAIVVEKALKNGFTSLPLLGPQVGGTPFRLGPITYYFQFISGKIFGANPESFAYPDLLWGILTLPILFLIFRRFFSINIALWLLGLASVSIFLVTFSRFSWNPNGLPFFTALFLWLFMKLNEKEKNKRWLLIVGLGLVLGIILQLHLAAALGIILGFILFILFYQFLSIKEILFSILIIILVHSPVLVSEWQTRGNNFNEFKKAFVKKGAVGKNHNILEKFFRAYQENSKVLWLALTGQTKIDLLLTRSLSVKCDLNCKKALPVNLISMSLFFLALIIYCKIWRNESDLNRKKELSFIGLWLAGFFLMTVFLAYQLEVRYYLGAVPVFFLLIGFAAEKFVFKNKAMNFLVLTIGVIIILINFKATANYLRDLSLAEKSMEKTVYDLRFGSEPKVTLGQLRKISHKASEILPKDIPVIINGESQQARSIYYVIAYEAGYKSCFLRGKRDIIPDEFSNIYISENNPAKAKDLKENEFYFGTLNATYKKGSYDGINNPLQVNCLK